MTIIREGARLGDQELIIETGRMARQAGGSVVVQYGDSQVLCTATGGAFKNMGFFPLVCDYVENQWAAGNIPGGYLKREGRGSTKATLTSRLIDRPIRPLFPEAYQNETQVVAWVISADCVNDSDVISITGCSAALMLSDIPFNGPVAGVRVGLIDGKFVANPTFEQRENSEMDIILAVTPHAIVMVEGEAKEVPENVMMDALEFGQNAVKDILEMQIRLKKAVGKAKMEVRAMTDLSAITKDIEKKFGKKILEAQSIGDKGLRYKTTGELETEVIAAFADKYADRKDDIKEAFGGVKKKVVRKAIIEGRRIDGRGSRDVRNITIEVGLLPRAHGSALFTRGETQTLVSVTLGTEKDGQRVDALEGNSFKQFLLHYNFPAFSVGEVRGFRSVGRREIGHGNLAETALATTLPNLKTEFPYTIRIVSDVLESNGSSSMASVCGGSLAMMDAGVPIKRPTAGIAMGLIKEGDDIVVLTDILGDEDHLGDMDFKVCGTERGITAFQLDTKIEGISRDTMFAALEQAKEARDHILRKMAEVISEPRKDLSQNAPRILKIKIPVSSIGAVIGQGGSVIRGIQEATGTTIAISDDGTVSIASSNGLKAQQAIEIIEGLTASPEVGTIYMGTVKKIVDFGAFIEILPGTEGLCHISELTEGRVDNVEDVLREGDECLVKVLDVDRGGKIRLSRRAALAEQGEAEAGDAVEA
jgi:polyribonucleotide nucleotidyltransferase